MATKISFTPIKLYHAEDKPSAILLRQNGRYTHSYTLPIKSAGTMLLLLRSNDAIDDEWLKNQIKSGNQGKGEFDMVYYQTVVGCKLDRDTLNKPSSGTVGFTESIRLTYRTSIVAPSNLSTDSTDLFVANSLAARASRQAGRTSETLILEGIEGDVETGTDYVYLILIAAKEKGSETPYIFTLSADEDEEEDSETIKTFLNGSENKITEAQILGYFPKDIDDFDAFKDKGFTITVSGNATLSVAETTAE